MAQEIPGDLTVAERLQLRLGELTPAERRVARALMADYPVGGLRPVAQLAAAAGVSAPTVVRLVTKLSFDGYAEFQRSLKSEVSARLSSPLELHAQRRDAVAGDVLGRTEQILCAAIRSSFATLPAAEFEHAVRLLSEARRRVTLVGGRFSSTLAEYLGGHLQVLRPGVRVISAAGADRNNVLLDMSKRDVLVAFDYRRYQHDTVRIAGIAKQQGAAVIAFTDPYLSPIAAHADVILTSSLQSSSAFGAMTPSLALVEAVITAVVVRLGDAPRARMARYDQLHDGTVDGMDGMPWADWQKPARNG
jgi:DNA-binding MurR/RpiR family transcriptional regulator